MRSWAKQESKYIISYRKLINKNSPKDFIWLSFHLSLYKFDVSMLFCVTFRLAQFLFSMLAVEFFILAVGLDVFSD